jgi:cytochrome P450
MTTTDGTATGDLYYDPYDYDVDANAQAIWKRMRDEAPVYWNDKYEFFALTRYDDIMRAVLDVETFSSAHNTTLEMMTPEPSGFPMMIFMDPPRHTWHRKVVSRAFTPKTVSVLEQRVTRLCCGLLDDLDGRSEFDFVEDYGAIIPPTMILALVGFPEGFEQEWRRGVDTMLSVDSVLGDNDARVQAVRAAEEGDLLTAADAFGAELFSVLPGLIEERRREPQDDLMSVLVHTDLDEDGTLRKLTDEEVFSFVLLLSAAGTETVARLLGWVGSLLDQHPDERTLLAEDPSLIANGIEECLRYEAPSPVNGRWVTADVEFHGQVIPKDSKLIMINGAGNRDERHFPEADRFDVRRAIDRHLSFGYGAHFCVGAALARLEGQVALREMLARHPTWEVDRDRAEMVHTSTVRGYAKLPVRV